MTIAANGRSQFVIRGALQAAQRANAAIIIEIAKSEGGVNAYCDTSSWNMARRVDMFMNELGITVPVAIHGDHYAVKNEKDLETARTEIVSMFDAGVTSIAIDASHQQDDDNVLANIELQQYIPEWAGRETEVGEIKGTQGLSTVEEALFHIQALNANGVFPDWIALNNGTTHGLEATGAGIQVDLTNEIHSALAKYGVSGAQHGTSGNDFGRLREIAEQTKTTKANVATALQMISWGVKVNEYGNAQLDDNGDFIKLSDKGVSDAMWEEMKAYAAENGWKGGNFKKLNKPFENKFCAQASQYRERMAKDVEDYVYELLVNVFNAKDSANLAIEAILDAGSYDMGSKASRIEDPAEWTEAKIREKATAIDSDKGPQGDFDD
jgi:fructose/tagatose bisphosphate aldolase